MARILVVDDSTMDQKMAIGLLRRRPDWLVETANNGVEALKQIEVELPDLILTDMQMPEMNGLELVRNVKQKHPLIPVILMTAQGSEALAVKALQQGADSYVPKQQLKDDLIDTMERVLAIAGERRTQRSLLRNLEGMRCRFVLNNDPKLLTSLVAYLQGIIYDARLFNEAERLRVGVALEEALLNAAYHGNLEVSSSLRETDHAAYYNLARERSEVPPYSERTISVDVDINREGVQYIIQDEGPGFDPSTLPDPTDPVNLEKPCGRGLLLMRTFMDSVDYNTEGNCVTMVKRAGEIASACGS